MMNKTVQKDILEIVKRAEDELRGDPTIHQFNRETLKVLLTSDDWHLALNEIEGRANALITARRKRDADIRTKKET